jgi:murein DD-endopeptidase MepM/ murein hydrolase activator NlpD
MSFDSITTDKSDQNQFSSLRINGIKKVNQDLELLKKFSYQPNFVIVESNNSSKSNPIFGDIVPMYSSYADLTSVIVTSFESLYNFVLQSNAVMVCLLSFVNQLIQSAVYQSYIIVTTGYSQIISLPDRFSRLKRKYSELLEILSDTDTRSLWLLEIKIDTMVVIQKLQKLLEIGLLISKKFYLSFIIFACLGILNISSIASSSSSSFLTSFLNNNSFTSVASAQSAKVEVASASTFNEVDVQRIIEHTVSEGQTLSELSLMFGITTDTVKINNQLDSEPETGKKLYIPWQDGYIYNTDKDITPQKLADVFEINEAEILTANKAIYNSENNSFEKDSLILIPSSDYEKVKYNLSKELEREKSLKAAEEAANKRKQSLARSAVTSNTFKGAYSGAPRSKSFNWPSKGTISRCVQPGHIACDLANFSAPPVFSMQDGVVTKVSNFELACYGLAVIVDHGTIDGRNYKTLYAHLSEIYVKEGERVEQNQSIGKMGSTGCSTGTHLHFEVIVDGVRQNPLNYLP